jgi:hypothetical protein
VTFDPGEGLLPAGTQIPEGGEVADVPVFYDHDAALLQARFLEHVLHSDAQLGGQGCGPWRQRQPGAERAAIGDRLERRLVCLTGGILAEAAEPHDQ